MKDWSGPGPLEHELIAGERPVSPARRRGAGALRAVLGAIALLVMIPCAAGILAWMIGRVVSDRFAWSQWLLWIPTPAALGIAVLGMLASLLPRIQPASRRRRRIVLWGLTVVAMGFYFGVVEHRLLRGAPAAPPGALRVVHWNLDPHKYWPIQPDARPIMTMAGDVTVLTHGFEVIADPRAKAWLGEGRRVAGCWPFVVITQLPIRRLQPLVSAEEIEIAVLEIDAMPELGRPLVMYLVDLPSHPRRPRGAIAREARRLLESTGAPPPDVVVGDFNMTRGSAAVRSMFPSLRDAYEEAGHGYGASFHREFPLYHIDHILLGDALRASRYDLIDPGVGRHTAQVADVVLNTTTNPASGQN